MKHCFFWLLILFVSVANGQKYNQDLNNIQVTWQLINNFYVDSVNPTELANKTIKTMLAQLDPHSVYLPVDEVKAANDALKGNFEGVGIEFIILKDTLFVLSTIDGGPSHKVGIRSGDRILSIDGKNVASVGIRNSDVSHMLRGNKGTEVEFIVARRGEDKMLDFSVVRDKIPTSSIEAAYMADSVTGYIKINGFASNTSKEFNDVLKTLTKSKMENLILDLRGNSGGYMGAALAILDQFLNKGQLMVYTQGATISRHNHLATSRGLWKTGGLVVLIDENSASASEIIAGAIQDWDRGLIVGRRSFGKGLVQRPFSLTDGSEVRLTIAKYYTPSGRSIQKDYSNGVENYQKEIFSRVESGELMCKDSMHIPTLYKYSTLVNKRTVYGGGGIVPDLFVPIDTTDFPQLYRQLAISGIINEVALEFFNRNHESLKEVYNSFEEFEKTFVVDESIQNKVLCEVKQLNGGFTESDVALVMPLVKTQIKALIARNIWGNSEFYQIVNPTVDAYQKALLIFRDKELMANLLE